MSAALECVLIIFLAVLIIAMIVMCVYLSKLLEQTYETMKTLKELAELTRKELEPALKSVNNVLKTADNVSAGINKISKIPIALLGAAAGAFFQLKGKGGFFSGLKSGFNLIKKGDKNVNR